MTSSSEKTLFGRKLQLHGRGVTVTFHQMFQVSRLTGNSDQLEHILMAFFTEEGLKNLILSPAGETMAFLSEFPDNDPNGLVTLDAGSAENFWTISDLVGKYNLRWPAGYSLRSTPRDVKWAFQLEPTRKGRFRDEFIFVRGPFERRVFVPAPEQLFAPAQKLIDSGKTRNIEWFAAQYVLGDAPWIQLHCYAWMDENVVRMVTAQGPETEYPSLRATCIEVAQSLRWINSD